jgi:hypothetical protein
MLGNDSLGLPNRPGYLCRDGDCALSNIVGSSEGGCTMGDRCSAAYGHDALAQGQASPLESDGEI